MDMIKQVKVLFASTLQLGSRGTDLDASSSLLGAIPELDSMAVVSLITALEEHFGFIVDDDEISADTFETLGSLVAFVEQKLNSST
ncbi:MAG: acyl carrier protein [Chromatiales bacterium]|nr:acyl carrier protein [Chromatiales bacterium]